MNEKGFGDSYDIVKRFLVDVIKANGYTVFIDPMFGARRPEGAAAFIRFIGARELDGLPVPNRSALLLDPDVGVATRRSPQYVTLQRMVDRLKEHELVFAFDQAFSRALPTAGQLTRKLRELDSCGAHGFYYDSHARFLFCSHSIQRLQSLQKALLRTGLPPNRLVTLSPR